MKSFKKTMRMIGFVFFLVLAAMGGIFPMPSWRKRDKFLIKTEIVEEIKEEETDGLEVLQVNK
ncbi:hypothetical protein R9C00_15860 [Flammeovirgaceae bacterium SG7u.111]|nr:hypothetical protein [Flammeovirgaceae bacterium SG7u.132]WPO33178.1 hypothetical protein R9C00_15860 [Flammeovirgaceae bacterium SG7u.111]